VSSPDISRSSERDSGTSSPVLYSSIKSDVRVRQLVGDYEVVELSASDLESFVNSSLVSEILVDDPVSALTSASLDLTSLSSVAHDRYNLSGSGVGICVLDSGANVDVLNLTLNADVFGYNFVNDSFDFSDVHGHGTSVLYPLVSGAPGATFYVGKVLSDDGVGYSSDVAAGLEWCGSQSDVRVVSLSLGEGSYDGFCDDQLVASTVNDLASRGILVVASSGNDGSSGSLVNPACASGSLPVAASTKSDLLWNRSNFNNATLLVAPGVDISTIGIDGSSVISSGTSFVSPFVSAGAALLFENDSSLTVDSLKDLLVHSGVVLNASGRSFSRLDVGNALRGIITNNLSVGSVGSSSGSGSSDDNFTGQAMCSSDSQCVASCIYGCELLTGKCDADSGCPSFVGLDGCCREICPEGTACSAGSCSSSYLCDNTNHCSGPGANTYYSGYQCGGNGPKDCSVDANDIGCCEDSYCSGCCVCSSNSCVGDNSQCSDYCSGDTRYYSGSCNSCSCDYSTESCPTGEDCGSWSDTGSERCNGDTREKEQSRSCTDYQGCSSGDCVSNTYTDYRWVDIGC
ncbi:MAG: S8 family peptidase, partial [Nanobdellota archaeon]